MLVKVMMFIASSLDGGAEKVVADLSNELLRQNVDLVVLAFKGSQWVQRLSPEIKLLELTSNEAWCNPVLYFQLWQKVRQEQPDIVHSHGAKASKIISSLGKFVRLRQIATKHNSRKGRIFNSLANVTAVSGKVAASIKQPATVIYNGVQLDKTLNPCCPDGKLSLLAVGRLDSIKRFDWLIHEIARSNLDCTLDIVGEGSERKALEALIIALGLSKQIRLLGLQTDVARRMTEKHAVIIASRSEGFSLVMVEALFYANLLISTEVGAAPELLPKNMLIEEGKLAEKLQQVNRHYPAFSTEYRNFTRVESAQFEMPAVAKAYLNYYLKVGSIE